MRHFFSRQVRARLAFLIPPLLLQAGCASVAIYGADVKERIYPGIVVLEIHPRDTEIAAVSTSGFGLTVGTRNLTLGYLKEFSVFAHKDATCRAIFLVEDAKLSEALRLELDTDRFATLCIPNTKDIKDTKGKP